MDAASNLEPNGQLSKYPEHSALWHGVVSLFSGREEELIEASSELWPTALRHRLNSALDQYEGRKPRRSPFRSPFFRPGFKYSNRLEFRDLSAGNGVESIIPGFKCSPTTVLRKFNERIDGWLRQVGHTAGFKVTPTATGAEFGPPY